jgi:tRNA nucleotidyltransferase/poly(A) polymerase
VGLNHSQRHQNDLLKQVIGFLRSEAPRCYIAGGYVRERLLGQQPKDVDLVVPVGAIPLARRLADATGGAFYVLDEETDAARIVYRVGPSLGKSARPCAARKATFETSGRKPSDLMVDLTAMRGPDITADLKARDFTINAMAIDAGDYLEHHPAIHDPCHGQRDLAAHLVRATGEQAFRKDPVRLLRALRFAATLDLQIEPETESWIRRDAALIARPSAERIRQELVPVMAACGAANHLRRMDELGLMRHVLPELAALKGVAQPEPHIYDVYEHTLVTIAEAERLSAFPNAELGPDERRFLSPFAADLAVHFGGITCEGRKRSILLKFAAMLHDVAKPATNGGTARANGRRRDLGHERLGANTARGVLRRLRFSAHEIRLVGTVVRHHMRPGFLEKEPPVTRRAIYRFFRDTGDAGVDTLILSLADHLATRGTTILGDHWRRHLELTRLLLDHYFNKPQEVLAPPPLVTGDDVMPLLGLAPGPQVGRLLEAVREAQAEGKLHTKEEALKFLRRHPRW